MEDRTWHYVNMDFVLKISEQYDLMLHKKDAVSIVFIFNFGLYCCFITHEFKRLCACCLAKKNE